MRKILLPVCVVALASSMLFTSCIGSFKLTNKVLSWNHQIGTKFVNELVFVGLWILPVYEISAIADALIINSIEFWSGTNPIEAGTKTVTSDNERYLVAWDNTGYKITNETTGEETRFNFDADTNSWALATPEGDITILTFIDDTHVKVPTRDGSSTIVELSDNGVLAYKDLVGYNNVLLAKK